MVCHNTNIQRQHICEEAYIGYSSTFREDGSSGGIFGELASFVIAKGGVVYGALFDECFNVVHGRINQRADLEALFGSKYVQSRIDSTFRTVKEDLLNDIIVLYSGTPCQIAGLRSYLKKDYKNLITIEVICHGVPSPGVWEEYVREIGCEKEIVGINFRDKRISWNKFSLTFSFSDGSYYSQIAGENQYMRLFLGDFISRNSCYRCEFRGLKRVADLTLGDTWSTHDTISEIYNYELGVSSIFVNSQKGLELLNEVKNKLHIVRIMPSKAIGYNNSYFVSPYHPIKRTDFEVSRLKNDEYSASLGYADKIIYLLYRIKAKIVCSIMKVLVNHNEKSVDYHREN